jgi:hypothetical protein
VSDARPIGVFDSGVGGLSVLKAIRRELPGENVLYVADSGYAPYGDRTKEFIEERAIAVVDFLRGEGVKAVVVACNTATGVSVETLRSRYDFPIVAMEPAVKTAVTTTRTRIVGVLATARTLSSSNFLRLVDRHGAGVQVLVQPCPRLVEQVENGELATTATRSLGFGQRCGYARPGVHALRVPEAPDRRDRGFTGVLDRSRRTRCARAAPAARGGAAPCAGNRSRHGAVLEQRTAGGGPARHRAAVDESR